MRNIVSIVALLALTSSVNAQQSRYLTEREVVGSFTNHTMMWDDFKAPDRPSAIVHYWIDNQIDILYDGQLVTNFFSFEDDGTTMCWRHKTVCRSFLYDGTKHVYVVNPNAPNDILAEVTRVTEDQDTSIFHKIAKAERDDRIASTPAESPESPATHLPSTGSRQQFSAGDAAMMLFIFGMLASSSSDNSSDGLRDSAGMTANERTAYWINQRNGQ